MPFGMEVGLVPDDIVLDVDPVCPPKGALPPSQIFGPCLLGPNGCMHENTTYFGTEAGLSLGDIVLDGDPAPPPLKGHTPPNFRPMYIVAKRLDG